VQCFFEAINRGEGRVKAQQLQRVGLGVVEHQQPIAKSIHEARGVPARQAVGIRCRCSRTLRLNHLPRSVTRYTTHSVAVQNANEKQIVVCASEKRALLPPRLPCGDTRQRDAQHCA
jgi:hypothetical protein